MTQIFGIQWCLYLIIQQHTNVKSITWRRALNWKDVHSNWAIWFREWFINACIYLSESTPLPDKHKEMQQEGIFWIQWIKQVMWIYNTLASPSKGLFPIQALLLRQEERSTFGTDFFDRCEFKEDFLAIFFANKKRMSSVVQILFGNGSFRTHQMASRLSEG